MSAAVRDIEWFAEQINKTPDWVRRHLDTIAHRKSGRTVGFTDADLDSYLDSALVSPRRMQTTGRRRSA